MYPSRQKFLYRPLKGITSQYRYCPSVCIINIGGGQLQSTSIVRQCVLIALVHCCFTEFHFFFHIRSKEQNRARIFLDLLAIHINMKYCLAIAGPPPNSKWDVTQTKAVVSEAKSRSLKNKRACSDNIGISVLSLYKMGIPPDGTPHRSRGRRKGAPVG